MPTQEMPMHYVNRKEWGALAPRWPLLPLQHPIQYVKLTYTEEFKTCDTNKKCTRRVMQLQKFDMEENNLGDIAPNFLVGGDGFVYEGRGWRAQPEKIPDRPDLDGNFIEVCFIGDWSKKVPPNVQLFRCQQALEIGTDHGFLDKYYDILDLGGVKHFNINDTEPTSM